MGYGGVFKKVVRIAVPVVVSLIPGAQPLAVAIASAGATAATGGSFKESLISGATSYIGASVSRGVSAASTNAAKTANVLGKEGFTNAGLTSAQTAAANAAMNGGSQITAGLSGLADDAVNGISTYDVPIDVGFGGFVEDGLQTLRSPLDVIQALGDKALGNGTLELVGDVVPSTIGGAIAGGATTLTLNQALLAGTPEADQALLDAGYTIAQIAALKQEARLQLNQQTFDRLSTELDNPFIREGQDEAKRAAAEEEFKKVLASGIERRNVDLGETITRPQYDSVFNSPNLGTDILNEEQGLRRDSFQSDINNLFNGNAFQPTLDDQAIANILDERAGPALSQVANFEARGNLNATGGKTAKEFINSQRGEAQGTLENLSQSLFQEKQRDINDIKAQASTSASNYSLGDDPFDLTGYQQQRQDIVDRTSQTLEQDIRSLLGNQKLFDVRTALNKGGSTQGLVSGAPSNNPSLLDTLAARNSEARKKDRGLGSRGSGVF